MHDAAADGFGHRVAEGEIPDEISRSGKENGHERRQGSGDDDGRDGVRGVVKPIEKIEDKRAGDDNRNYEHHTRHRGSAELYHDAADKLADKID